MKTARAVRYDELEGKTVSGAGFGFHRMLIAFTDGTVLALTADENDGPEINFEQNRDIDLTKEAWSHEAYEAGLLTKDEYQKASKSHDAERIARLKSELANLEGKA